MKSDHEIIERIKAVEQDDWMGTQRSDLIQRLEFEAAKSFLKQEAKQEDWKVRPRDKDFIKAEMLEYMPFAWDRANDRRGLSAARSLDHMSAWLFLLGMDKAADAILEYYQYGKPQLRAICEHFGWDWLQWDDGRWTNSEMSDGEAPPEAVSPLAA